MYVIRMYEFTLLSDVLSWPKSLFSFFRNIKDTSFVLTNNFIDFNILSWLPHAWYNIDGSQLMSQFDCWQLQLVYLTMEHHPVRNLQHETSQTTLDPFHLSHSTFSIICTNLFFAFSSAFAFLKIIKHNMPECYIFSSIFNIKMATQSTNFFIFYF